MYNKCDSDGVEKFFIRDKYGKIRPQQWGIYSGSGFGKSLVDEGLAEAYLNEGCVVIYLGDGMKGEEESAFAMFEPTERYHLDLLKLEGKTPKKIPVKLYHPFSFGLPSTQLPNYNVFTIPIKGLNRKEFSMMAETQADSDTIRMLMQSSDNLSDSTGLYQFLHNIQDLIKGNKGKDKKPSSKNFFVTETAGNSKNMQDIINLFQPFKTEYFLANNKCKHSLNFKDILSDNQHLHFFSTKYMRDPKIKEFLILLILNKIQENKEYAKHPVCIIIPEIRKLCPDRASGYQKYLSDGIKEALSTMRNTGKGFSSILSSQSFNDTSQEIRDSHTITLLGKLNSSDIDKFGKIYGYNKEMKKKLAEPDSQNSWFIVGQETLGAYHFCLPSWGHAEPSYNFETMFKKHYPEKIMSFRELKDEMKLRLKEEEDVFREKINREIEAERQRQKRKAEEKGASKPEPSNEKIKEVKAEAKIKDMERAYALKEQGQTLKQIAETYGNTTSSVSRWIQKIRKMKAEQIPKEAEKSSEDGSKEAFIEEKSEK